MTIGAVLFVSATIAYAQTNLGSIQGTVSGSDGTPIYGARVFAAVPAANQKIKAPPILIARVVGGATAHSNVPPASVTKQSPPDSPSTFLISNLPPGSYVLCVQTSTPGWLDPCHWSSVVPVINLAAGQNVIGQNIVMTKGAVIQIRLNDPSKALSTHPGPIPRDVEIIARASNNAYYNAQLAGIDPGGQTRQLTLPFGVAHTLTIRSQQLALADVSGAAVPSTGRSQSLQVASGAAAPLFTFTVLGRAH